MVYIHLADGFEEIEAITVIDILRRAGLETQSVLIGKGAADGAVALSGRIVTGSHGIAVSADLTFEEADYASCEMIVLPGGMPGTSNLQAHAGLKEKIQSFARQGKWLAAICAAPVVFGELRLLEGRRAVCFPGMEGRLSGAELSTDGVVVDGKIITSKGPGTAAMFAYQLVAVLAGEAEAERLRREMCAD